ncbi:MAG: DUF4189 domain-containing protein [Rhodocyclaceae bacterium]|nr:DUF4189 domain-containing protein [Rhodocyclaceae bacterium]
MRRLCCAALALLPLIAMAQPASPTRPSWGAIASSYPAYGYAFEHSTREAAEHEALNQCRRNARKPAGCEVRTTFDRACGAYAQGNFGEWGAAVAPGAAEAAQAAAKQCDNHLPTEPCRVVVRACSPR